MSSHLDAVDAALDTIAASGGVIEFRTGDETRKLPGPLELAQARDILRRQEAADAGLTAVLLAPDPSQ